ncbi:phosphate ABC transporter permease subunit PstC [Alkalibacterium olivapovliticus]|uniref:Phosphate transport system permease protein n=1 Tax=Alkalibacterium olivapovliticus TaxID=99907 RepID=A0A2T0W5N3_9LACT|nr:phosphate ABC transporter permease subunit PstC [Alkalibacterium olivapovliticus]PRY81400.1 phosphate transport system permease protein [Alkalibacterium olivapovliticus]
MQPTIRELIKEKKQARSSNSRIEKTMPKVFFLMAAFSILVTIGIVYTLLIETFYFFTQVSFVDFITGTEWYPFFGNDPSFGIWPLVSGTFTIAAIAMMVAVPLGLSSAVYLSEYASERNRKIIKPILEVLAGVPTVVYGLFALTFVTPLLQSFIPTLPIFNALSPGIVVGIMIIPQVASLSQEAMNAVPQAMRDGAFALGATRLEVALKIVIPGSLSGIISSLVLALSRAIGETMIVATAAGSTPNMGFNPTESIQTMTAYIVQVSMGDATFGSTIYYSIYAVGMLLFVFTLLMNIIANYFSRRFREVY